MTQRVDTRGWKRKKRLVELAMKTAATTVALQAAQDVYNKTNDNLSGPGIKPGIPGSENSAIGEMPVPRRTGNLAQSLKLNPLTVGLFAIFTDARIAGYDKYVHDGTKHMKPRRYLGDVIQARMKDWFRKMDKAIRKDIRRAGR